MHILLPNLTNSGRTFISAPWCGPGLRTAKTPGRGIGFVTLGFIGICIIPAIKEHKTFLSVLPKNATKSGWGKTCGEGGRAQQTPVTPNVGHRAFSLPTTAHTVSFYIFLSAMS